MDAEQIERVRAFNRYYTQHLGLLTDRYLGQGRALGPARLLYEIGSRADLRDLRERLGLDAGYLTRLLRALQTDGLVEVRPHPTDRRARVAELTDLGHRERAELDERSRRAIVDSLGALTTGQRAELVRAQTTVHRMLRLAATTITPADPATAEARACLLRYAAELRERFPEGYDTGALTAPADVTGTMLLAREDGQATGCGLWTRLSPGVAELRHLWIAPDARGLGLGRRLLTTLEADAAAHGITTMRLGTHRALVEAIDLYRRTGYMEIPNYSDSPYNQLTFEKPLPRTVVS
ncbi:MarR family winged helix-turn-helix transcriptional regulator [Actinoplanes sp. L3-i22]|uniref:MarR family winged helix-turn-helix transcriptional regulator n=1 Tax=Actinoplanes sp. L3-i22 TaxID=2836373 RepID=UPI001C78E60B|nr:MarR family winged helix-turn-helix transcriptional regulator [Actinoplanes sp. L3-i22]BCY10417.1 PadR family transcriptional regulator [Actinoplanes sp. L3-i22]